MPGFLKAAATPNFSGVSKTPTFIEGLYNYGLFFTFFVAGATYLLMSLLPKRSEARRHPNVRAWESMGGQ